jgi:hypothetical protein
LTPISRALNLPRQAAAGTKACTPRSCSRAAGYAQPNTAPHQTRTRAEEERKKKETRCDSSGDRIRTQARCARHPPRRRQGRSPGRRTRTRRRRAAPTRAAAAGSRLRRGYGGDRSVGLDPARFRRQIAFLEQDNTWES